MFRHADYFAIVAWLQFETPANLLNVYFPAWILGYSVVWSGMLCLMHLASAQTPTGTNADGIWCTWLRIRLQRQWQEQVWQTRLIQLPPAIVPTRRVPSLTRAMPSTSPTTSTSTTSATAPARYAPLWPQKCTQFRNSETNSKCSARCNSID